MYSLSLGGEGLGNAATQPLTPNPSPPRGEGRQDAEWSKRHEPGSRRRGIVQAGKCFLVTVLTGKSAFLKGRPAMAAHAHDHTRREALRIGVVLGLGLLALRATGVRAADAPPKPNLVIILMDDMGYGDIAPFNPQTKNRTPNLDRMAREGMKLTSFYACPVCTPSRAQLLDGLLCQACVAIVSRDGRPVPGGRGGPQRKRAHHCRVAQGAGLRNDVHRQMARRRPAGVSADAPRLRPLPRPALLERHGGRWDGRSTPPPAGVARRCRWYAIRR